MPGLTMQSVPLEDLSSSPTIDYDGIASIVWAMKKQEDGVYRTTNYLARTDTPSDEYPPRCAVSAFSAKSKTDSFCREKMSEWCFQVVDFCDLHRETVGLAMSNLDRFLATSDPVATDCLLDRKMFQLSALTALYMAVKINEVEVMDPKIIVCLSRGSCTEREVIEMEMTMLFALKWQVQAPTALAVVHQIMALLPTESVQQPVRRNILGVARFQAELAVNDYYLVANAKPSLIAYAATLNAIESVDDASFPAHVRFSFIRDLQSITGILTTGASIEQSALVATIQARLLDAYSSSVGSEIPRKKLDSAAMDANKGRGSSGLASPRCVRPDTCIAGST